MAIFNGKIRPIASDDLSASKKILSSWLNAEEVEHYFGFIKNSLDKQTGSLIFDNHYFVAETQDKEVIGIIGYRKPIPKMIPFAVTKNPLELNMLYVLPKNRQGQGVGTALVNEVEKMMQQKKYTEILIRSAKKFEKSGWGFYDQLPGFKRIALLQESADIDPAQIWQKIIN